MLSEGYHRVTAESIVAEISKQAEAQASRGEGFDLNVNDPTEILESDPEESKAEFIIVTYPAYHSPP